MVQTKSRIIKVIRISLHVHQFTFSDKDKTVYLVTFLF